MFFSTPYIWDDAPAHDDAPVHPQPADRMALPHALDREPDRCGAAGRQHAPLRATGRAMQAPDVALTSDETLALMNRAILFCTSGVCASR